MSKIAESFGTFWILDVAFSSISNLNFKTTGLTKSKAPRQTPLKYSRRLLLSSSLIIFCFIRALTLDHCMDFAIWNICCVITSINYWRDARKDWRRTLDMIVAVPLFFYHVLTVYIEVTHFATQKLIYFILAILAAGCYLVGPFTNDRRIGQISHSMMHLIGGPNIKWCKVIEQNIIWEWTEHYVSYKRLKKIIKKLQDLLINGHSKINGHSNKPLFAELQHEFDALVHKDLNDVETFFSQKEGELLSNYNALPIEEKTYRCSKLEKYAYLNGEGFRKILKKYDKKLGCNASKKYVPLFESKSFYHHHTIQQLLSSLSPSYEPVICSFTDGKSKKTECQWESLPSFPFKYMSQPFMINDNQITVIPSNCSKFIRSDGIYTFDGGTSQWKKIINYANNFECDSSSIAFNKEEQIIYVWFTDGRIDPFLYSLSLRDHRQSKIAIYRLVERGQKAQIIHVDDCVHIITSSLNMNGWTSKHIVYDESLKQIRLLHIFQNKCLDSHKLIFISSKNMLLLIGRLHSNYSYKYCVNLKKWTKWKLKIPKQLTRFTLLSTRYDQFVLLIGGWDGNASSVDDIFVFDLQKKKVKKSKVKCPIKGEFRGIISNDLEKDCLLTFGFVAECYKEFECGIQCFPYYLVEFMSKWVCHQNVHLIAYGPIGDGMHWKINVDEILK